MNPFASRSYQRPEPPENPEPLELREDQITQSEGFDRFRWSVNQGEARGAGGRQVLGFGLVLLAALWIGYTAWTAGRSISAGLTSPAVAYWVAVAAGPLGLLGLIWLIFGRTRRKEAERFTRSVIAMRSEAQSLEALLEVLSQRINESRGELTSMTQQLMQLGDQTTTKFGGITRELNDSTQQLRAHGDALDRAAGSARNDIAVLLEDLPNAEATAQRVAEQLRAMGAEARGHSSALAETISDLAQRSGEADRLIGESAQRLQSRLTEIEAAGSAAAGRIGEADANLGQRVDALLERTAAALHEIRTGIDAQSSAVDALVTQSAASIATSGMQASEALAGNVERADAALAAISGRVAEQHAASERMISEIDRGLALIDERFRELASHGDERANHFLDSLTRARAELDSIAEQANAQDGAIGALADRTGAMRESIDGLVTAVRDNLGTVIEEAQGRADHLSTAAKQLNPEIGWLRDAAVETSERLAAAASRIAEQQDSLTALLAGIDEGVSGSDARLVELRSAIADAQAEAGGLTSQTAPALVAALVQVREAASHAAERAREAISAVIPESAGNLSTELRQALETVIRESIEERLQSVDATAARAVESARAASDRLSQQMISLGQSAAALEHHLDQSEKANREKDSEAFARRVALLMDSMHSAAIDVGKILSDEIDDKAWDSYLKGNRGVFTRRAVRLLGGSETRAIQQHYEADLEFQRSVNRYIADFEAMLRRVLAERDGGMIAVTLMSSDMGKLYAALAQVDRRR